MPNLNKVMLMGTLTRDPEVKYLPKGTAVAQIGMAINREYKTDAGEKREEVTFVDVEFFGRTAEVVGEYLKKGRPVFVEGRLKLDTWDDKQTGQKRSKLKVMGEKVEFLGSREGGQQQEHAASNPATAAKQPAHEPDLDDSGLPF